MTDRIVPDTSIIIDGKLTELIEKGELQGVELIIPVSVVDELENQANSGKESGYSGLDELKDIRQMADSYGIDVRHAGERPSAGDIEMAKEGRIDGMIRDLASEEDATLYTADYVQAQVAEAMGIDVSFFEKEEDVTFSIRDYFQTDDTMSVHLKEGVVPKAKQGTPGDLEYTAIDDTELSKHDLKRLMKETFEKAQQSDEGLVEMNMEGATVLQIGNLRIAMTQPPFSEAREITAVKPSIKVGLEDYEMTEKLKKRLSETAEGILVAGAPGHGKSTFSQALAEFYEDKGQVVKTMEHPRDLQVGPGITQYAELEEDMANTGDLLLLVRPDFTVFDEVRKTEDFEVFADMRLAGVGMIGVVHASEALDAVQRLIGRVEMGVIPQVVDTVVFIQHAEIAKVYKLELTVKVPEGMMEADLARPVIQVKDFETDEAEYEIYTYGEETVVIPVTGEAGGGESGTQQLARKQVAYELQQYANNPVVEFEGQDAVKVYVDDNDVGKLIGKQGATIDKIEKELGLSISVEPRSERGGKSGGTTTSNSGSGGGDEINYHLEESGDNVVLLVDDTYMGKDAQFYSSGEHLFTATIGKGGKIKLSKGTEFADLLLDAHMDGDLTIRV